MYIHLGITWNKLYMFIKYDGIFWTSRNLTLMIVRYLGDYVIFKIFKNRKLKIKFNNLLNFKTLNFYVLSKQTW
jgi:hypothetical protein